MFTDEQLKQLTTVLDERLDHSLQPIREDIATLKQGQERLELKIAVVNERVTQVEQSLKNTFTEAISENKEDTIRALSALIHTGYNLHEKRIQRLEETLHLPPLPTPHATD